MKAVEVFFRYSAITWEHRMLLDTMQIPRKIRCMDCPLVGECETEEGTRDGNFFSIPATVNIEKKCPKQN